MIVAVAYTEYQLLQIQAIIHEYNLSNVMLITFKKNRIPIWLIDENLFEEIYKLPAVPNLRINRVRRSFIEEYHAAIKKVINGREIDLMIGAQDENTIFTLIKKKADPIKYWNIEDGMANYYERSYKFKVGIFLKKILFKIIYGHDLNIAYGHGKIKADKIFRMDPSLSNAKKNSVGIGRIIKRYFSENYNQFPIFSEVKQRYHNKTKLIISSIKKGDFKKNNNILYKFHPQDIIPKDLQIDYVKEIIPVELLVLALANIETVQFDVVSSSMLNILNLVDDLCIRINFNYKNCRWEEYITAIISNNSERIELNVK